MSSLQSVAAGIAPFMSRKIPKSLERLRAPADEGLLLTDVTFRAVALDEGASWILTQQSEHETFPDAPISLPGEIRKLLNGTSLADLPAAKLRLQAGKFAYHCRIFLLTPPADSAAEPLIAVRLRREMSAADAVYLLAEQYHLTDREQETLKAIANGLTSKETAEHMSISPNTVKSFMRVIMLKMGVTSRAAVVGKLLEYTNDFNE